MTVFALPPHLASASGKYVIRCEGTVFCGVPLCCHGRVAGGKVVKAGKHLGIGAIGAATVTLGAAGDGRLVVMPKKAAPPNPFVAERSEMLRCEGAVFCGMPLVCDIGIKACQVIKTGDDGFPGADRTAVATDAR